MYSTLSYSHSLNLSCRSSEAQFVLWPITERWSVLIRCRITTTAIYIKDYSRCYSPSHNLRAFSPTYKCIIHRQRATRPPHGVHRCYTISPQKCCPFHSWTFHLYTFTFICFEIDTQMDRSWNGNPRPLIFMFFHAFLSRLFLLVVYLGSRGRKKKLSEFSFSTVSRYCIRVEIK